MTSYNNDKKESSFIKNAKIEMSGIEELDVTDPKKLKPELNLMRRFTSAVTAPSMMAEDVERVPKVLTPLLFMMLITMVTIYLNMDTIIELQRRALIQTYMRHDLMIPSDGFDSILQGVKFTTIVSAGLAVPVIIFIMGALAHLFSGFFGGEGSLKRVVSAMTYAYIVVFIGSLISIVLTRVSGAGQVLFSPAMILGSDQMATPLYSFLSNFDIFNIWFWVIGAISLKIIEHFSMKKAIVGMAIPVLAGIIFQTMITLMSS